MHRAEPASFRDLRRVHTDAYLDSLARPDALLQIFGLALAYQAAGPTGEAITLHEQVLAARERISVTARW